MWYILFKLLPFLVFAMSIRSNCTKKIIIIIRRLLLQFSNYFYTDYYYNYYQRNCYTNYCELLMWGASSLRDPVNKKVYDSLCLCACSIPRR